MTIVSTNIGYGPTDLHQIGAMTHFDGRLYVLIDSNNFDFFKSNMADGRHLDNKRIAISRQRFDGPSLNLA